jgi:hypothetical protein
MDQFDSLIEPKSFRNIHKVKNLYESVLQSQGPIWLFTLFSYFHISYYPENNLSRVSCFYKVDLSCFYKVSQTVSQMLMPLHKLK